MSIAIDTNVLVGILVQDPTAPDQRTAARRLVADATAAGEPLLVSLSALLEAEWVLRSSYQVSREAMASAFIAMLEAPGIEFEHDATVEEALYLLDQCPGADFADCLLVARAAQLGRSRFVPLDAGAARRRTPAVGRLADRHLHAVRSRQRRQAAYRRLVPSTLFRTQVQLAVSA